MYRWSACPGSVRLGSGVARKSSEYAAEGTAAHEIMEKVLTEGCDADVFLGRELIVEGRAFVVDEEMVAAIQLYADAVRDVFDADQGDQLFVEHRFDLSHIYDGLYGTADTVIWKPKGKRLIVKDLKYGAGLAVEVKENPQLRYYALGALVDLGLPARRVRIEIVQPRCPHPDGPIRHEEIDAIELMDFATDLIEYAKATEDPNAPLNPGDHCRFCPAAALCPALHGKAQEVAARVFADDKLYDPALLADTLTWLPVLEGWIKSVREFAYAEAEDGRSPPGWKLVEKRATRKWRDEAATVTWLRSNSVDEDSFMVSKLASPAAVEKLLPKDQRGALEELCVKESSGHSLAPVSDKRPAAKESATDAFLNV